VGELLDVAKALGPKIRELAPKIEADRRLDPELAQTFGEAGIWRMCTPGEVGGLELPLDETLTIIEALSRADGAVGWCAMIAGTSGIVFAYLDPAVSRSLLDPTTCTCGVVAPSGRAVGVDGGFRVSGRWAFGSNVWSADLMALSVLTDDDPPLRTVLLPATDYEILDTWHTSGLRGTGSHDVVVDDVFVPYERVTILGEARTVDGPLYEFPVFGLLALGVATVCLGIARGSIDELKSLAAGKTPTGSRRPLALRSHTQMEVAKATAELDAARAFVFNAVADSWGHGEVSLDERVSLRLAATHAARTSAYVVDRMYDLGGGSSIYESSKLQRDFRDIHAATQHLVVSPSTYELTGRVLLGVETEVGQL
jgi:alkylation response protein AidB-like acyl-CoA dehydrogenase